MRYGQEGDICGSDRQLMLFVLRNSSIHSNLHGASGRYVMADILSVIGDFADKVPNLFNWVLKRTYKLKDKIDPRITIALEPHHSAVEAQVMSGAYVRIMFRITNFTPFDLTVERATLEIFWDDLSKKIYMNNFESIPPCSSKLICLRESLSMEEAGKIVRSYERQMNKPRIEFNIDFGNRLYPRFNKSGLLENFDPKIVNYENAKKALSHA